MSGLRPFEAQSTAQPPQPLAMLRPCPQACATRSPPWWPSLRSRSCEAARQEHLAAGRTWEASERPGGQQVGRGRSSALLGARGRGREAAQGGLAGAAASPHFPVSILRWIVPRAQPEIPQRFPARRSGGAAARLRAHVVRSIAWNTLASSSPLGAASALLDPMRMFASFSRSSADLSTSAASPEVDATARRGRGLERGVPVAHERGAGRARLLACWHSCNVDASGVRKECALWRARGLSPPHGAHPCGSLPSATQHRP